MLGAPNSESAWMITVDHEVRYARPSQIQEGLGLCISCAQGQSQSPGFFQGRLTSPRRSADLLLALSRVVASRFHLPAAMLARILRESDPVITCTQERMRWEGFSACCSVYARVDMWTEALEGALLGAGTTNVDLGPLARHALAELSEGAPCGLWVGPERLELQLDQSQVVERKVPLPLRWLKGFVESRA